MWSLAYASGLLLLLLHSPGQAYHVGPGGHSHHIRGVRRPVMPSSLPGPSSQTQRTLTLMQATGGGDRQQSGPAVLCFGEALVDRLGPPGGDPAKDLPVDDRLGGAPANVACGLGRLGTRTAFLGRLGKDDIGAAFGRVFRERGVDERALQWDQDRPSRIVLVRRDLAGDRQFGGFSGDRGSGFADQAVDEGELQAPLTAMLQQASWLLVGTLPLASPGSAAALIHAVERAVDSNVPVCLDVNWRPTFWSGKAAPDDAPSEAVMKKIQPLLHQATMIKLAAEEARWLFDGATDPSGISQSLPQRPSVLVTDGGGELRWSLGGSSGGGAAATGAMPAFAVKAVDTTGAGDAFVAGLLHTLCKEEGLLFSGVAGGEEVRRAVTFAAACGALVCQGAGAIDPQPSEEEVLSFLKAKGLAPPQWAAASSTR